VAQPRKALVIYPDDPLALTGLGYGYALAGKRAEAQRVLDKLTSISKQKYVSAVFMAKI
jgi:hypothetical protein